MKLGKYEDYNGYRLFLRNERKRQELSQATLAARVGISRTLLTKLECGTRNMSIQQAKDISKKLNVDDWRHVAEVYTWCGVYFLGDEGHMERGVM